MLVDSKSMLRLLLGDWKVADVAAQRSDVAPLRVLLSVELVHIDCRRLEENRRVDRLRDVMLELWHRRADLHVRSEAVLNEVVLLLSEALILVCLGRRLDKLRSLGLMNGEVRSCLLNKSTLEDVLILNMLEILRDCVLIVLMQRLDQLVWWCMMRNLLLTMLMVLNVLLVVLVLVLNVFLTVLMLNVFLVGSEIQRRSMTGRELLLVLSRELRSVELLNWSVEWRQLLIRIVEVWRWALSWWQVLSLRSL